MKTKIEQVLVVDRRSQFHVPPGREVRVGRAAVRAPHRWVGRTRKFSIVGSEEGEDEESVAQGLDETPQNSAATTPKPTMKRPREVIFIFIGLITWRIESWLLFCSKCF